MLKILLPVVLLLVGLGAGVGAGLALAPPGAEAPSAGTAAPSTQASVKEDMAEGTEPGASSDGEFVKMSNHFVVPVVSDTRVEALVVASLSLEVDNGDSETVYSLEPKLRDVFLQTLLDHASIGGFDGRFTATARMDSLRLALLDSARSVLGKTVRDVLITEIARQDS